MYRCNSDNGKASNKTNNNVNNNANNDNSTANNQVCSFFSLPPLQFTILSTLLTIVFIETLNTDQQNTIANFLSNVGQMLSGAASQGELLQSSNNEKDQVRQQIQMLKRQISALEQELGN